MSSMKYTLVAALAAVVAAVVVARPHSEERVGPPLSLSEVLNKTMCPIHVFYDRNPKRVPRLIKHLKCANTTNRLCAKTKLGCCRHHHLAKRDDAEDIHFSSNCVEIEDTVLVTYDDSPEPQTLQVSVGCTCMLQEMNKASAVR